MLYFAYGSNLDYTRMFSRCSSAKVYGKAELYGYRLVFMENNSGRVVANIVEAEGETVHGVLYDIVDTEIKVLDRYEGYPFVYNRLNIGIEYKGKDIEAVVYIMGDTYKYTTKYGTATIRRGYGVPKQDYFRYILNGYTMFDLPQRKLLRAYDYSKTKEVK